MAYVYMAHSIDNYVALEYRRTSVVWVTFDTACSEGLGIFNKRFSGIIISYLKVISSFCYEPYNWSYNILTSWYLELFFSFLSNEICKTMNQGNSYIWNLKNHHKFYFKAEFQNALLSCPFSKINKSLLNCNMLMSF